MFVCNMHALIKIRLRDNGITYTGYDIYRKFYVIPMRRQMGRNFILMQDNARPHTARIVHNFLKENSIEILPHLYESRFKSHRTRVRYIGKKASEFGKTANQSPATGSSVTTDMVRNFTKHN